MNSIELLRPSLPPTAIEDLADIASIQAVLSGYDQRPIPTDHLLHAGMYTRTITMPPMTVLVGTLIKIPTIVVTIGAGRVLLGKDWAEVDGVQVLPASANRKQIFISKGAFVVSMIFPTSARTVREAEQEFTDEHESLLSRKQNLNKAVITEEANY